MVQRDDYNGPVLNLGKDADGKVRQAQIFANTGINLIANLGSGTPLHQLPRLPHPSQVKSALLPKVQSTEAGCLGSLIWTRTLIRTGPLPRGEGENASSYNVNVYFWIGNLLNSRNINSVYPLHRASLTTMAT